MGVFVGSVTDIYLPDDSPGDATCYPGNVTIPASSVEKITLLRNAARSKGGGARDYVLDFDGDRFRCHRQVTVDGVFYILRKVSESAPKLGADVKLPSDVARILVSKKFGSGGGLIVICGEPGQGKSTTCAAIIMERVTSHGSFALMVEDPPEFPMHGDYDISSNPGGKGKIIQVPASSENFASDLKDALRCYPSAQQGSILMVGEIRDGVTAANVLRAALNGQLVFITMHAGTVISAIERLVALASFSSSPEEARMMASQSIKAIIQQRLDGSRLTINSLFSTGPDSSVASRIRQGNFQMLSSELSQQQTYLERGLLYQKVIGATDQPTSAV